MAVLTIAIMHTEGPDFVGRTVCAAAKKFFKNNPMQSRPWKLWEITSQIAKNQIVDFP